MYSAMGPAKAELLGCFSILHETLLQSEKSGTD
jgi:hypothetical protein